MHTGSYCVHTVCVTCTQEVMTLITLSHVMPTTMWHTCRKLWRWPHWLCDVYTGKCDGDHTDCVACTQEVVTVSALCDMCAKSCDSDCTDCVTYARSCDDNHWFCAMHAGSGGMTYMRKAVDAWHILVVGAHVSPRCLVICLNDADTFD